jgi:hypothetical protein
MTTAFFFAWCLTIAAGAAVMATTFYQRGRISIATTLGYGIVFGMFVAGIATALTSRSDTQQALRHAAPLLIGVVIVCAVVIWFRARRPSKPMVELKFAAARPPNWKIIVVALGISSLFARAWILLDEILLRPTYPWDAWVAWAVKSKTWFLLGHYAPFVAMPTWLASTTKAIYTGPTWEYPSTLAWIQIWFASAIGDWIEPLVNLPWFALWIGLLLGHYGQWRALGVSRLRSLIFVYALGSLPLIDTNVALAGYADLWVATLFGFAVLAWLRWLEHRERTQLLLAIVCAAVLPFLKHEGVVWAFSLFATMAFAAIPARWRWRALGGQLLILVVFGLSGGLSLLTVFGWVRSGSHAIELPVVGSLNFGWHGEAALGVVQGLFVQPNWHLLWWLVPPVVIVRWKTLRDSESLKMLGLLLAGCMSLLMILFVFTDAARWAESYTAVNRLVMHLVPALVTFLALLLRDAPFFLVHRGTTAMSDRRLDPA